MFERFREFARALLLGLEQPHVLDRDHRLIGEGGSKLDLLVGEGLDSSALENDHADRRSFPYQRNAENGADTAETCPLQESEFGIGLDIRDMNDAAIDKDPPGRVAAVNCERTILHECYHFGCDTEENHGLRNVALWPVDLSPVRVAEAHCGLDQCIEHRFQIERRAANDLEHVGSRGLLLQRLAQIAIARLQLCK